MFLDLFLTRWKGPWKIWPSLTEVFYYTDSPIRCILLVKSGILEKVMMATLSHYFFVGFCFMICRYLCFVTEFNTLAALLCLFMFVGGPELLRSPIPLFTVPKQHFWFSSSCLLYLCSVTLYIIYLLFVILHVKLEICKIDGRYFSYNFILFWLCKQNIYKFTTISLCYSVG